MDINQTKEVRQKAIRSAIQLEKINLELNCLKESVNNHIEGLYSVASELDNFYREIRHLSQRITISLDTSMNKIQEIQSEISERNEEVIESTYRK